jgi:membrane protein DedA with SNARE-associated domain
MMPPVQLLFASGILSLGDSPSAFGQSLALIITFVLALGGLVNALIAYIIGQVMVERRENQERQQSLE